MPTQTLLKKVSGEPILVLKSRVSTRQFRLSKDGAEETSSSDLQQWLKRKQSIWKADTQNAYHKDQMEEINQILVAENPQLPDNLVEFSFKDKNYVTVEHQDHNIVLLGVEGTILHLLILKKPRINLKESVQVNWKLPILIVVDVIGTSQVSKLSPNLRIRPKIPEKQQGVDPRELEMLKLWKSCCR